MEDFETMDRGDFAEEEQERKMFVPDTVQMRRGGAQGAQGEDEDDEEAKRKLEERERKKAEVRKRLEEQAKGKKAKKGFLTPDRKKKLRKLLMMKAAEDLKQQQLLKEQERQRILNERIIPLPNVDSIQAQNELEKIARQFHQRICELEDSKYDLEYQVRQKDFEINELNIQVNDLRGKFVKPALKKVSKYDNKLKKFKEQTEGGEGKKLDFRSTLKQTAKADVAEILETKMESKKAPDWAEKQRQKGVKDLEDKAAGIKAAEAEA